MAEMADVERNRMVIEDMQYARGKVLDSKGEKPRSEYQPSPDAKAPPLPYNRRTEGDQQPSVTIEPEAKKEHVPLLNEDSRLKSFQRERERPRSSSSKKRRERSKTKDKKKSSSKDTRKGNQAKEGPTVDKVSKNSISGYSGLNSSELNTSGINRKTKQMMEKELKKKFNV